MAVRLGFLQNSKLGTIEKTYATFIDELVSKLNDTQKLAKERLLAAKEKSKQLYDQKLNTQTFEVGDEVFLLKEP